MAVVMHLGDNGRLHVQLAALRQWYFGMYMFFKSNFASLKKRKKVLLPSMDKLK